MFMCMCVCVHVCVCVHACPLPTNGRKQTQRPTKKTKQSLQTGFEHLIDATLTDINGFNVYILITISCVLL